MFVNRSSLKSSTQKNVSQGTSSQQNRAQRRSAVVGLAVAATVSVVSVTFTRLHAQDTTLESAPVRPLSLADGAAASDIDLLKQGLDQFKNKQYDEAKATLAQVNGEMLSKSDQKKLVSTLADADAAAGARRDARAQFDQAEAQLNAGKLNEAKALYKAAADNKFADDATRQKAKEQIALANAMQEQKAGELKAEYQQAKKDFESGNYADAKAKFTKLDAAGFKAPMFQGSPADYLKKTDAKMAAGAADTGTAAVAVDGAKPTAEAPKAEAQPQAVAPVAPAAQPAVTDQTQTAAAPQVDEKAAKEQAKAEKARLEAEAKAAKEADKAKAQEEKAKAQAEAKAAEDNAKAAQAQAREQYKTGLAALKAGDYAAARENFKAADAAGYKPSLFEASAAKMLAEVDQAEAKAKPEVATGDAKAPEADAKAQAQAEKDAAKQKEAEAKAQAEADKVAAKQKEVEAKAQAEADRKAAEAQAEADKAAAKAQANADKVAATTRQVAAREQYKAGLTALKAGDYATARTAFKAADDAGFKPGLFEATGAKMLAEVDKEEADAKAKAEKMAAREAEKAQKAQAEADRKAAEAKAQADKEAAEAQAKADKTAAEATAKTAEAQAKVAETKPEVAAPAVVAKPEGTTPAVEAKPEVKAEGTTPAVETQPAAEAKPVTEAKPVEAAPVVATPTAQAELDATAKMDQIKAQARAYEAQRLVDQAQTAQKEGRTADALDAYTKAAQTDPTNQAAVAGREQMLALQGRVPVASSMLDQVTLRNRAAKQSIAFSFNDAIERARAASAANKFDEADRQVNNAQIARDQDPNLFTTEEIKAFDTTIASTRQEVAAARLAYNQAEQQRVADARIGAEQARLREIKNEQQATIASLIAQSRNYVSKNQYREALSVVDQILSIDPTNDYARGVRPLIEDKSMLQTQREYKQQFNTNWVKSLNAADERLIPYDDIYRLPTNWPDISESRDLIVQGERGLKEADRQVQLALERKLPEVKFDGVPFEDVIEFLRDTTSTNIFVNWKALDQVPIDHKAPVVAGRLRDVRFSKVLQTVLDSVSTDPNNKLTYTVDEGVITISTTQDVSSRTVTRVYDITDLIIQIPSIDIGNADLGTGGAGGGGGGSTGGTRSGGGGGRSSGGGGRSSGGGGRSSGGGGRSSGGGGGGSVFGGGGGGGGSSSGGGGGNGEFDRQASVDDIATLVEETVDVTTWEAAGGQGSIRPSPLNQQLIITQTPEVHRKIQGLLDQLRETLAIQVTVECRFLTVSRNFMDDVGMDFDFTFNPTGSSHWSPIPVAQGSSSFTANPATGVPGTIGTSSPTPSLQTSGTYLDQFRVDYLIRATQASVNQSVVTAPRVTVYNGGEAMVVVTTDTSYVSSLEPEVASGVVGYTPQIDQTTDGVSLFVRANVSADRKYVTLYLRPTLQRVLDLVPFSFQTATTLPTGGASGNTFVSQGSLTIQEPRQQTIQVETLVAVPDGGTLLLGGQTISGEVEREAGVPILSKIPILKRIFTNRSTAKDESVLLLLVKPTIIINKEQEQKQFPLLSSKISGS